MIKKSQVVVGVTGASGSVYGWRLLEKLRLTASVETHLILSRSGERTAFLEMGKKRINALVTSDEQITISNVRKISDLATKQRIPSIGSSEFAEAGGLIGYGVNAPQLFRRAATFVDKILKGTTPGDIPVEQPTLFEMVVNMKTAKALGVKIQNTIMVRATKVIQ